MLNAFKTKIMLNVLFYNNLMVELEMIVSKLNKITLNNKTSTYQSQVSVAEHQVTLIRSFNTFLVHDTSTGGCEVGSAAPLRSVNIVGEGEKGVRGTSDTSQLLHVLFPFLLSQRLGHSLEQALPLSTLTTLGFKRLASDEQIDGIGLVGSLGAFLEGQLEDTRVVSKPPVVSLVTSETSAVDTRLLAGTETDDGTIKSVTNGVRLGVLESKGSDDEIGDGRLGEILVGGDNIFKEGLVNLAVVSLLLEGNAVDLSGFDLGGNVGGVHLEDTVLATLLLAEDLKSLRLVARRDDTV